MFRHLLIVLLILHVFGTDTNNHRIRHKRHRGSQHRTNPTKAPQPVSPTNTNARVETRPALSSSTGSQSPVPSCGDTPSSSLSIEEEMSSNETPQNFEFKCTLLINEIRTSKGAQENQNPLMFAELIEKCGKKARRKQNHKLDGHMILIVKEKTLLPTNNKNHVIELSQVLTGQETRRVAGAPEEDLFVFTIGNIPTNANIHMQFSTNAGNGAAKIPPESRTPTAVLLLKFNPNKEKKLMNKFVLSPSKEPKTIIVTEEISDIISTHLLDMFIYGTSCDDANSRFFRRIYSKFPDNCATEIFSSESMEFNDPNKLSSFSRCGEGNAPFNSNFFILTEATPSMPNKCTNKNLVYPYRFQGKPIQSSGMKLILNSVYAVKMAKAHPSILQGDAWDVVANLHGISKRTVTSISRQGDEAALLTPGKRRLRGSQVLLSIDGFDRDWIRRWITNSYKNGIAPEAKKVFQSFLHYKRGTTPNVVTPLQNNNDATQPNRASTSTTTNSGPVVPGFQCSYSTFRRLLILMGYKYKTVDNRAAIVQRPDLVRWRGAYLKELKKNDALPKPKKLIYLDETWIDVNMRLAKGWAPKYCPSFRELAAYSYSNNKIGRGGRLIVLSAVTEDGVIPESVKVYKVAKNDEKDDYHKNVDAQTFQTWISDLSKKMKETGEQYIFIMDNASYHSARTVPKKSEKKEALYNWLAKMQTKPGVNIQLSSLNEMRKWELEGMLDTVAALPSMRKEVYTVDKIVAQDNHDILRLPPYHCVLNPIELVWKDLKRKIQEQNVKQTLDSILPVAIRELKEYDPKTLKNHFNHVNRLREQYWTDDGLFDSFMESRIVISTADDDDSDEDDSDSELDTDGGAFQCYTQLQIDDPSQDGAADDIPYGDDEWTLLDQLGWLPEVFADEIALGNCMVAPPRKRTRLDPRCLPTRLTYD